MSWFLKIHTRNCSRSFIYDRGMTPWSHPGRMADAYLVPGALRLFQNRCRPGRLLHGDTRCYAKSGGQLVQKKNLKFSLDILMCCHGHSQPLQPVASAHLWGRHHAGVALTKPELEVSCLRGDDFGCWIHGEGGMLLAGHHMEPPNRTGTTLKWKMMKDVDGNRHIFGEGWKQLSADLKLHSGLCAHGLFEYWLDRSAKAVSCLGTHLI